MAKVHKFIEEPTLQNSLLKPESVSTRPIYVSKKVAAEMFSVSRSTIYKWTEEASKDEEWSSLSIRPSSTITLLHLETLERFIRSKNKSFL